MRPTARARQSRVLATTAKLCRQYLKWYGNGSYKPERNGERWLLQVLSKAPVEVVLDVGANVGKWSLLAAEAFSQALVYALEIVPMTAATLRLRTAEQSRIRTFEHGLAAETGSLCMHFDPSASTHATYTDYPHDWTGAALDCLVMRGDEFLAQQGIAHVDFLKIDVEGAEHLVLQGLADTLARGGVRFIQFEYGRVNILTHFLLRDFYHLLEGYGYRVGKIYPDHVDLRPYELNDEDFLGPNYLACRADEPLIGELLPLPNYSQPHARSSA